MPDYIEKTLTYETIGDSKRWAERVHLLKF